MWMVRSVSDAVALAKDAPGATAEDALEYLGSPTVTETSAMTIQDALAAGIPVRTAWWNIVCVLDPACSCHAVRVRASSSWHVLLWLPFAIGELLCLHAGGATSAQIATCRVY
jgi:hypothetical protein